jgi:hypothetical protein
MYASSGSVLAAASVAMGRGLSREEVVAAIMRRAGKKPEALEPNAILRGQSAVRLADKKDEPPFEDDSDESSDSTTDSSDESSETSGSDESSTETDDVTNDDVEEAARAKDTKLVSHAKLRALAAEVLGKTHEAAETARDVAHLREMADDPADISALGRAVDALDQRALDVACAVARGRAQAAMRSGNAQPYAGPVALEGDALTKEIHRVVIGDGAYSNGGAK